jgi:hypothetical protein
MIKFTKTPSGLEKMDSFIDKRNPLAHTISDETRNYLRSIGSIGGASGAGKSKARTSSQARKASNARWDKARTSKVSKSIA